MNALNFCELHTYNRNYSAKSIVFLILFFLAFSEAADENTAGGSVPPTFKGTRAHYNVWYTAFCGWLAMKYPDLIALVQEELEEPDEPAAGAPADEVAAFKEYWNLQKRLYGTLIAAVPNAIRTSLRANANYNGLSAWSSPMGDPVPDSIGSPDGQSVKSTATHLDDNRVGAASAMVNLHRDVPRRLCCEDSIVEILPGQILQFSGRHAGVWPSKGLTDGTSMTTTPFPSTTHVSTHRSMLTSTMMVS